MTLGNLAGLPGSPHTRFTYHRTWETGLEAEILGSPRLTPIFFAFSKMIQDKTFF
jgi:hypothetical protein